MLPLCRVMAEIGKIEQDEMLRATNMGIGMVVVVRPSNVDALLATLKTPHYQIGQIIPGEPRVTLSHMKIQPANRRLGILLSGRGSNFEAIADQHRCGQAAMRKSPSSSATSNPLRDWRARASAGLNAVCIPSQGRPREEFDRKLVEVLNAERRRARRAGRLHANLQPGVSRGVSLRYPQHSSGAAAGVSRTAMFSSRRWSTA